MNTDKKESPVRVICVLFFGVLVVSDNDTVKGKGKMTP